ncbi:MAG: hypothetical protein IKL09_05615 [Clostridia bacterium]|nr:hypothetical protein [Clostridia bacterium]
MRNIILRRIITLSAISILCFVVGIAYGIATGDKILMMMSAVICVVNVYKIWDLKRIEKKNKYIILSGKCMESSYNLVGRYRVYKIQSGEDELEVSVPKSVKLENNKEYAFYFKEMNQSMLEESKWLRNKLLSENYLGYENIEKTEGEEE